MKIIVLIILGVFALDMMAAVYFFHSGLAGMQNRPPWGLSEPNMVIIGAVMRKLMHIIYGVLKSGMPFDPAWSAKHA